jgi:2-polyprenyl-3-methyl-5-hydroxy-6-metoxy-1,4-benzoquinol methylase
VEIVLSRTSDEECARADLEKTARFYDAAAARYDAELEANAKDLVVRQAFRTRVSDAAGSGGLILDFGCGTGLDALWYAEHGHRVVAYDLSPGMIDHLRRRCRPQIETRQIVPIAGSIDALTTELTRIGPVRVVAANFAVLNHIRELRPALHALAEHLTNGGTLMANNLNPFYIHDMRQRWWWQGAVAGLWTGSIRFSGDVTTYRHLAGSIRRAAAPELDATEVIVPGGSGWKDKVWSNFVFITLRKRQ